MLTVQRNDCRVRSSWLENGGVRSLEVFAKIRSGRESREERTETAKSDLASAELTVQVKERQNVWERCGSREQSHSQEWNLSKVHQ